MPFERYHEAVDYLQRRLWHELPITPVERALQARVRALLAHLGEPQRAFPVLHVGGSAGKGSTATIAASVLQAAGHRTGLYTSPHLQTFIERADVDGVLISPDTFAEGVLGLEPLVRKMHIEVLDGIGFGRPSLVEVAFAVAMKHFADERCDAAVVEVGLGGRTDCTNVFDDNAPVAVITNVEREHAERLGPALTSIAAHKADIIHGGACVTGATGQALAVIERVCGERGARLLRLGSDVRARTTACDRTGSTFDLTTPHRTYRGLRLPLAGAHQVSNAALAIAAAEEFSAAAGAALAEAAVRDGIARARLNGRLETVQREPIVLLDSAHNPVEARRLAAALRAHWLGGGEKLVLVIGILADKEQGPMVRALAPLASRVVVTQPPLGERAGAPDGMLALFRRALGDASVTFEPSPGRALDSALADAGRGDVVCVTGSMFLVGALRERWCPEPEILRRRNAGW